MRKPITVRVSLKDYTAEAVRYAAHSLGGAAYALLKPLPGGVLVELAPKKGDGAGLAARLRAELEDERLRERVAAENRELREFMLLKALTWRPRPQQQEDSGLTPQQEKELNDLISQIEGEIKAEGAAPGADPLGITSTWEEKNEDKKAVRKKR